MRAFRAYLFGIIAAKYDSAAPAPFEREQLERISPRLFARAAMRFLEIITGDEFLLYRQELSRAGLKMQMVGSRRAASRAVVQDEIIGRKVRRH